jgi:hypothetical protein
VPYLVHHDVNAANQITGMSEYAQGDTPAPQTILSDSAGNIVSDGIYYFQHDACQNSSKVRGRYFLSQLRANATAR